ncbi:MAG: type II toxin-antitoxin system VapC family toxin [Thermoplasmataceae archaeon]
MTEIQVIDSSIIAKYVSKEQGWEEVGDYIFSGFTLRFSIIEISNVLWKKIRKNEMSLENSMTIITDLKESLAIKDDLDLLPDALKISITHEISVYDALFITLTIKEKGSLITCDRRQSEIATKLNIPIKLVL